jgi:tRNA(adenine34) deaminase
MTDVFMQKAVQLAHHAQCLGEVPVGAVVVYQNQIIAQAFNQKEMRKNVLFHAEMIALTQASAYLSSWRLTQCIMVISLEPCLMCAHALSSARIQGVIFGAHNLKSGGLSSGKYGFWTQFFEAPESSDLLKSFFSAQRALKKDF